MENEPIRVFISSIVKGYQAQRNAAMEAIQLLAEEGFSFQAVYSENFPSQDLSPQEACLEGVRISDIYLGILGEHYSKPVEDEYLEACRGDKPRLIFEEDVEKEPQQERLLKQIKDWSKGRFLMPFKEPEKLKFEAYRALRNLIETFLPRYLRRIVREFGEVSLLPIEEKNLTINQLIPLSLVEVKEGKGDIKSGNSEGISQSQASPSPISFQKVIESHKRSIIFGPSGSGKTTGLRLLAFELAKRNQGIDAQNWLDSRRKGLTSIPVYLKLARYRGSLIKQIGKFLEDHGIRCSESHIRDWLEHGGVLLLLDGFDEVSDSDKEELLDDLESLLKQAPSTRYVISAREIKALTILRPGLPRFRLSPLGDEEIEQIFRIHLGDLGGRELFHSVVNQNLFEPFRLPLLAWFVALTYRNDLSKPLIPARGWLYQQVLEDYFLKKWESREVSKIDGLDKLVKLQRSCLARLAYEMLYQGQQTLEEVRVDRIYEDQLRQFGYQNPLQIREELLGQVYSHGLLERSAAWVSFAHSSFRDYFAAVWLKQHASPKQVVSLSAQTEWHEAIVFLCGILDDIKAQALLRRLLKSIKWHVFLRRWGYYGNVDKILLTLKCLLNTRCSYDELKDEFIRILPNCPLYLGDAEEPVDFQPPVKDPGMGFYIYIGRLGTERSLEYLLNLLKLKRPYIARLVLAGLGETRNPTIIEPILNLFRDNSWQDIIAKGLAGSALSMFKSDSALPILSRWFEKATLAAKIEMLGAMRLAMAFASPLKMKTITVLRDQGWIGWLAHLSLYDKNEEIREKALSVLRQGAWGFPKLAEQIFIEAAAEEEVDIRAIAVEHLLYSLSEKSLAIVEQALEDANLNVRLTALWVLMYRSTDAFPDCVVRFLRNLPPELCANSKDFIVAFKTKYMYVGVNSELLEKLAWLVYGLWLGGAFIRLSSVRALGILGIEWTAPYIGYMLKHDESEDVRYQSVIAIVRILGSNAEDYLIEAFRDLSPNVRRRAALAFHADLEGLRPERARPYLEALLTDPDRTVRWAARESLRGIKHRPFPKLR